ncbi:hypothetical protein K1T73_16350 [Roseovarius sp. SCSIO 43702]|uniref:hypothetical protein n=1 Tax=Roseovarius sp. SCSIO 43702 TaxID=2823043 RepID=UPI001C738FE3|nr:hypothetical protein [Roseovarius sp. SCSIO 43702]QYX56590.1 hypothetical protein K1T73_16350 [Roseovarius sp. SCSIO 43702]
MILRRLATFAMCATAAGTCALADDVTYVSSYGDEYSYQTNENGAVLTSLYPKAWFIEGGANSRIERGADVLYLGTSCDARHGVFGDGTWWWANGGFGADFPGLEIRFPRQEIRGDFGMNCRK